VSASRFLSIVAALSALAAAPTAAPASPWRPLEPRAARGDPARFLRGVVSDIVRNDYAHAWLSLYPAQQRVAPVEEYVACESKSPVPGRLESVEVVRSVRARVAVAGASHPLRGFAVTFFIRLVEPSLDLTNEFTTTVHAVPAGARWAWILPRARYLMYAAHAC
jgi:hypothetical protein